MRTVNADGIFVDVRQYIIGLKIVDLLLVAVSFRAGIESFVKAIQQMAIQKHTRYIPGVATPGSGVQNR